jgi:hypothetical protein
MKKMLSIFSVSVFLLITNITIAQPVSQALRGLSRDLENLTKALKTPPEKPRIPTRPEREKKPEVPPKEAEVTIPEIPEMVPPVPGEKEEAPEQESTLARLLRERSEKLRKAGETPPPVRQLPKEKTTEEAFAEAVEERAKEIAEQAKTAEEKLKEEQKGMFESQKWGE